MQLEEEEKKLCATETASSKKRKEKKTERNEQMTNFFLNKINSPHGEFKYLFFEALTYYSTELKNRYRDITYFLSFSLCFYQGGNINKEK